MCVWIYVDQQLLNLIVVTGRPVHGAEEERQGW